MRRASVVWANAAADRQNDSAARAANRANTLPRRLVRRWTTCRLGAILRVRCGAGSGAFTYDCDVLALNPPPGHHVEWTEIVVCRAKPLPGVQRCSSSRGEALQ